MSANNPASKPQAKATKKTQVPRPNKVSRTESVLITDLLILDLEIL